MRIDSNFHSVSGAHGPCAIDFWSPRRSVLAVHRFRHSYLAAFLAVFWLFATLHCELEAAEIFESHAVADQVCCDGGEEHCSHDGCQLVEGGHYSVNPAAKVSSPQLALCYCLICLSIGAVEVEAEDGYSPDYFERPLDWVPTWQFVQRAALSPRAPSLMMA
jgi:hypothetical protein